MKTSILDVWQGSECASELAYSKVTDISFLKQFEYLSKVTDNLLAKNQKEGASWTLKLVEWKCC